VALVVTKQSRDAFDVQLAEQLGTYYADPLGHVMFSYPWERERSIQLVKLPKDRQLKYGCEYGPDGWACDYLEQYGSEVLKREFDGKSSVEPILFTTASGHGIGKSVIVAWIIKFILDTRPFARGIVTATTADQLRTRTWAEVGKWHKMSMTRNWFEYSSGRGSMSLYHKQFKEQWRCDAQTAKEENSESFAGLHAANSTPFYIFDEASGVPDKIFEVREGGTTDGEPHVHDFGNPTRNTGRFFENMRGRFAHRYIQRQIDSRSVAITNKERIAKWIEDYGLDSDFVKVRVLGEFPSQGTLQFIPSEMVEEAMARPVTQDRNAPLVIGVDAARFGDDETVIYPRIGYDARSFEARKYKGLDTVQVAGKVIQMIEEFKAIGKTCSALFVDGTGMGAGVVDQLRHLGYNPLDVQFAGKPTNSKLYRFKTDELWGNLKEALPKLALPEINSNLGPELKQQLTQREFGYTLVGQKIQLESKKDMKERLGADGKSPDIADALALTFASPVVTLADQSAPASKVQTLREYDPLEVSW